MRTMWSALALAAGVMMLAGCLGPQDAIADKAFQQAVSDQKTMAAQDERAERDQLRAAEAKGLAVIEAKRAATGKALEGMTGPSGKPLLDWTQAEKVNNAFGQLRADFERAVAGLDLAITAKYAQRNTPIAVTEAFFSYEQARRHIFEYTAQGFSEQMLKALPGDVKSAADVISKMKSAGLPTSIQELVDWVSSRAAGCANGQCTPLAG